jgi:hypothetical protein
MRCGHCGAARPPAPEPHWKCFRHLTMQGQLPQHKGTLRAWTAPEPALAGRQLALAPRARARRRCPARCRLSAQQAQAEHSASAGRQVDALRPSPSAWQQDPAVAEPCVESARSTLTEPILSGSGGGIFFFWRVAPPACTFPALCRCPTQLSFTLAALGAQFLSASFQLLTSIPGSAGSWASSSTCNSTLTWPASSCAARRRAAWSRACAPAASTLSGRSGIRQACAQLTERRCFAGQAICTCRRCSQGSQHAHAAMKLGWGPPLTVRTARRQAGV